MSFSIPTGTGNPVPRVDSSKNRYSNVGNSRSCKSGIGSGRQDRQPDPVGLPCPAEARNPSGAARLRREAAMAGILRVNQERRMAERARFELAVEFPLQQFSRLPPSTTRPPLQRFKSSIEPAYLALLSTSFSLLSSSTSLLLSQ